MSIFRKEDGNVKNWVPISVIVAFAGGFVSWYIGDTANNPTGWYIVAGVTLGSFFFSCFIGYKSEK